MSYKEMGYELNESSIHVWRNSSVGLRIHNVNVPMSLYDGSCSFISEEECKKNIARITPREEYKKIWSKFDCQALQNVIERLPFNENDTKIDIIIKSCDEFENMLKDTGIYELYIKEKESLDKKRKLLEKDNLIEVEFRKYQSWETGLKFLILAERVEKNIFNKLIKAGLYYHEVDEDNEEIFTGWCIENNEMNILKLAENGIKVI